MRLSDGLVEFIDFVQKVGTVHDWLIVNLFDSTYYSKTTYIGWKPESECFNDG